MILKHSQILTQLFSSHVLSTKWTDYASGKASV